VHFAHGRQFRTTKTDTEHGTGRSDCIGWTMAKRASGRRCVSGVRLAARLHHSLATIDETPRGMTATESILGNAKRYKAAVNDKTACVYRSRYGEWKLHSPAWFAVEMLGLSLILLRGRRRRKEGGLWRSGCHSPHNSAQPQPSGHYPQTGDGAKSFTDFTSRPAYGVRSTTGFFPPSTPERLRPRRAPQQLTVHRATPAALAPGTPRCVHHL
jgi:hypothetical protein